MPAALIGGAVGMGVGAIGQAYAGARAADASQRIAEDQLAAAKETRGLATAAAAPTASELAMMHEQQGAAERGVARSEALFASVDPALMESGKQALQLLQGQSSPLLNPMLQERQRQRAQLQSQLQSQLGSGYASSSAGSEALNRFDQMTTANTAQVQQQTYGMLMGQAVGGTASEASANSGMGGYYSAGLGAAGNVQQRQVGAIMGTDYTQHAGASNVGAYANAQNMGQLFGNIGKMGGMAAGYGLGAQNTPSPGGSEGGFGLGNYGQGSGSSPQNYFGLASR